MSGGEVYPETDEITVGRLFILERCAKVGDCLRFNNHELNDFTVLNGEYLVSGMAKDGSVFYLKKKEKVPGKESPHIWIARHQLPNPYIRVGASFVMVRPHLFSDGGQNESGEDHYQLDSPDRETGLYKAYLLDYPDLENMAPGPLPTPPDPSDITPGYYSPAYVQGYIVGMASGLCEHYQPTRKDWKTVLDLIKDMDVSPPHDCYLDRPLKIRMDDGTFDGGLTDEERSRWADGHGTGNPPKPGEPNNCTGEDSETRPG